VGDLWRVHVGKEQSGAQPDACLWEKKRRYSEGTKSEFKGETTTKQVLNSNIKRGDRRWRDGKQGKKGFNKRIMFVHVGSCESIDRPCSCCTESKKRTDFGGTKTVLTRKGGIKASYQKRDLDL